MKKKKKCKAKTEGKKTNDTEQAHDESQLFRDEEARRDKKVQETETNDFMFSSKEVVTSKPKPKSSKTYNIRLLVPISRRPNAVLSFFLRSRRH